VVLKLADLGLVDMLPVFLMLTPLTIIQWGAVATAIMEAEQVAPIAAAAVEADMYILTIVLTDLQ
jgi:hypothetical protein